MIFPIDSAPDLRLYFKHLHWRVMPHSMGVEVASDFADYPVDDPVLGIYKHCGLWTVSEADLLYRIAKRSGRNWLDIGSHTCWTSCHIATANKRVIAVDPMYREERFKARALANLASVGEQTSVTLAECTSNEFFEDCALKFDGIVIDGDHKSVCVMADAANAAKRIGETGVVVFHDFIGRPVRAGVEDLMELGFKCRVYFTPHMVACCWRGAFTPPDYTSDPKIPWGSVLYSMRDFDFGRTV